jgi:hypothetical protein
MGKKRPSRPRPQSPPEAPAPLSAAKGNRALRICDAAALAIAAAMLLVAVGLSTKPADWPQDAFSDLNTLMSGENFAHEGLMSLRFLPIHYAGPDGLGPERNYYTHYPPLPDVVNGLVRLAGITSLSGMRLVAAIFGIAGWLLLYRAIARAMSPLAGVIALAFVAGSGYFLGYAISVQQHGFNAFFLGLFLLFFLRAVHEEKPGPWPWAVCWAALMLESLNTFEFILYPQVFGWVYLLAAGAARRNWKRLLLLATAPAVGVGLHFLQNAWALGWAGAWADRLGYGQYGGENRWAALAKLPRTLAENINERCFHWPWYVLALLGGAVAAAIWLSRRSRAGWRSSLALLAGAAAAPWAWYILMAAHAHHPHTVNQIVPLAAACFGAAGAMAATHLFRAGTATGVRIPLAVGGVLIAVMAYGGQEGVRARLAPRPPGLSLVGVAEALGRVPCVPDKSAILFNATPEAHLAYFVRHYATLCPMRGLPFPDSLPHLQRCLPEGWNYSSYLYVLDDQEWLFKLLRENCPGKVLTIRGGQLLPIFLFDIRPLLVPTERRQPLAPARLAAQTGDRLEAWERWSPPGLDDELTKIAAGGD